MTIHVPKLARSFAELGATTHDRILNAVLIALAALLPILIVFAHRGVAPVLLAMGLAAATRAGPWNAGMPFFLTRPRLSNPLARTGLLFLAFCLWTTIAGLWSPVEGAWRLSLNVGLPVLAAGAAIWEINGRPSGELKPLARAWTGAIAAAAALLVFEAAAGGYLRAIIPPTDQSPERMRDWISLGRGLTALSTMLFAGLALLVPVWRSKTAAALIFVGIFAAAARFSITANVAGLAAGTIAFYAGRKWPRATIIALAALALLLLAAAPLAALAPLDAIFAAAPEGLPASWLQRLVIWKTAAVEALGCLPLGCGADYARALSEAGAVASIPGAAEALPALPIHPHNLFLELWLEMGIPGVVLFGAALVGGAQALLARDFAKTAYAVIAATTAFVLVLAWLEMSIWQVWRVAAAGIAGVVLALAIKMGGFAEKS